MIDTLIVGSIVLVFGLHTVDEIHNCNNPEFDKDKEYDNFVCNWEKDDFEYLYIDNVGLVHELKKESSKDNKTKKKYRDKYWNNKETNDADILTLREF